MANITISLPDSWLDYINESVKEGGFGNVSEYFRMLLREESERRHDRKLEQLLLEAINDPRPDIPITPEFWENLRKEVRQKAAARLANPEKKTGTR